MESEKTIVGKCPLCGSDVVKTMKGYACVRSLDSETKCQFFLFSNIGNRRISDSEATQLLEHRQLILDGFSTNEGKVFTSVLRFNPDGSVNMNSKIGTCPKCGGLLYIGMKSVSCSNFRNPQNPCNFTIWRNICGHDLSFEELTQIITQGSTSQPINCYDKKGVLSSHLMGLNADKEVVKL